MLGTDLKARRRAGRALLWTAALAALSAVACGSDGGGQAPQQAAQGGAGGSGGALQGGGSAGKAGGDPCAGKSCDDGIGCTIDTCKDGQCLHAVGPSSGPTVCPKGQFCTLAKGCVATPACANDQQCADLWKDDACKANPRCEAANSVCAFDPLDKDKDGHSPLVCGGDDCDDGDGARFPNRPEVCDGKDNDCDGDVDEQACGAGGTGGNGGTVACDDKAPCPGGVPCVNKQCVCGEAAFAGNCEWSDTADCPDACAQSAPDVSCSVQPPECEAKLPTECTGQMAVPAGCEAECQPTCEASCAGEPSSFACAAACSQQLEAQCLASAEANCKDRCAAEADPSSCKDACLKEYEDTCKGSGAASCQEQCKDARGVANCKGSCQAACKGACDGAGLSRATCDAYVRCVSGAVASCKASFTASCPGACQAKGGLLACGGQALHFGGLDEAEAWAEAHGYSNRPLQACAP